MHRERVRRTPSSFHLGDVGEPRVLHPSVSAGNQKETSRSRLCVLKERVAALDCIAEDRRAAVDQSVAGLHLRVVELTRSGHREYASDTVTLKVSQSETTPSVQHVTPLRPRVRLFTVSEPVEDRWLAHRLQQPMRDPPLRLAFSRWRNHGGRVLRERFRTRSDVDDVDVIALVHVGRRQHHVRELARRARVDVDHNEQIQLLERLAETLLAGD